MLAEIFDRFNTKKIDYEWSFHEFKPSERGKWTHNFHRYPAKFIPQLVEKLIDNYIKDPNRDIQINDPFYGCGTTILTALSRGFKVSGTDINPIAYLITKVKSTPIEPYYLDRKIKQLLAKIKVLTTNQTTLFNNSEEEPLIPGTNLERINYWFNEKIKIKLGKILRIIYEEKDEIIRDFFLIAFSHCLKNFSIWLQSSTKPTRDLNKKPVDLYQHLRRHLNKMRNGNNEYYNIVPEKIKKNLNDFMNIKIGDARKQPVENETVDLVITSSPYVTSYEYADLHQLSIIWLDLAGDWQRFKQKFIGTSYKRYNKKVLKSSIARMIINQLNKKDKKTSETTNTFFIDMQDVFSESYRILQRGGRCCYVIGNTRLKGVDILNAQVFAESLMISGFELDAIIKREIHSKLLPQTRDEKTGRFASSGNANISAYPVEYIVIGLKR